MKFSVNPEIFSRWKGMRIAVVVITGMDNQGESDEIGQLLQSQQEKAHEDLKFVEIETLPEIAVWRKIYKDFGASKEYISSIESLLKMVCQGKRKLPRINNLVDLYNFLSLKYRMPVGAEDLDKIAGEIFLTLSDGTESGVYLGGKDTVVPHKGEVIYKDLEGFICRRWNWREADRTKIEKSSKNAVMVVEKAGGIEDGVLDSFINEAKGLMEAYLGGKVSVSILDRARPSINIPYLKTQKDITKKEETSQIKPKAIPKSSHDNSGKDYMKIEWGLASELVLALSEILQIALTELYPSTRGSDEFTKVTIEQSAKKNYGDYTTNIAFIYGKKLGVKPFDLARIITAKLNEYIIRHQTISSNTYSKNANSVDYTVSDILENAVEVIPGFINLTIQSDYLITHIKRLLNKRYSVRTTQTTNQNADLPLKGKKIMVEYTDPNPFKELHIGHIYSNCVGESLARFFEVMGADVKRADYFGDVGMHVAKSLYGILLKFNIQNPKFKSKEENIGIKKQIDELEKLTLKERVHFLGEAYAMGASKFETDKKSIEEIKDINYYVFISAQKYLAEKYGFTPQVDYKKYLKVDPDKLEMIWMLFSRGRQWSLDYFESIYKRLGTKFDFYYPESAVGEFGYKIVMENVSKGIFEKSDKAIVYKGEKEGLHTRVFINSLGLPTYEAKELGLAMKKFMDFEYDYSFIITGKEINEYFDVLMNVLSKVNDKLFRKNIHIGHGMVRLPKGKMSSRTGQILTAQWLLDEVKAKIAKIVEENGMGQSAEEAGEIAEKSAVAAIKYSLLKVAIPADLVFDFEKSLSFSGESGPYLLYTYARCKSVLRKASDEESQQSSSSAGLSYKPNSEERDTILYLNKYPEVVKKAVQSTAPNLLCTYLYELAQKYNLFYQKHRILESNNSQQITDNKHQSKANSQQLTAEFRLFLTQATSVILKDGLQLLGIETVERM